MPISPRSFAGVVFLASAAVLGAALASQYWGGLAPCELCLKERWSWDAALVLAALVVVLSMRLRLAAPILVLVFAAGAALAFYHVGVEQHWFAGPSSCTAGASAQTVDDLRRQILGTEPVLCDQVQWSLFHISLAGWNLIASLAMTLYCLFAWRRA